MSSKIQPEKKRLEGPISIPVYEAFIHSCFVLYMKKNPSYIESELIEK